MTTHQRLGCEGPLCSHNESVDMGHEDHAEDVAWSEYHQLYLCGECFDICQAEEVYADEDHDYQRERTEGRERRKAERLRKLKKEKDSRGERVW